MILGLRSHSSIHQISSITLTNPIRKPQTAVTPFFQFLPTQTHSLQLKSQGNGGGGDAGTGAGDELPRFKLRWRELVLDTDRDNIVAVGLTGALAWAGVHVLWRLFVVTMAIMIAAIKYTFVGVMLIFIVITLL